NLRDGHPIVEARPFRDIADVAAERRGGFPAVPAQYERGAGIGFEQSGEHSDRGSFAGPVIAKEREDGPAGHLKRQLVDGDLAAEAFRQSAHVNDRFHQRFSRMLSLKLSLPRRWPLARASSCSTRSRISSGGKALTTASCRASRMCCRIMSLRRSWQSAGASGVTSIPLPRRAMITPSLSNS